MTDERPTWRKHLTSSTVAFRVHIQLYRAMLRHPRTPWISKVLLGIAVAYALSPIDLIPDFIPVIGYLDDVLIIPVFMWMALHFISIEVREECSLSAKVDQLEGAKITHGSEME